MPATYTDVPLVAAAGAARRCGSTKVEPYGPAIRLGTLGTLSSPSPLPHCFSPVPGRKAGLTLLELLGVIVVLSIVWGFVYPATEAVRRSSRRRQALTEMQSLATAVLLFRDTYGRWPLQDQALAGADLVYAASNVTSSASLALLNQADLIRALTPGDEANAANPVNPRRHAFLEVDRDRMYFGCFADPWSTADRPQPYVVAVDANGDGAIGVAVPEAATATLRPIDLTVSDGRTHHIPVVAEPIYVFSWSDTAEETNRVSTVRHQ